MRTIPDSHVPEQPRWLGPLFDIIGAAALMSLSLLAIAVLEGCTR